METIVAHTYTREVEDWQNAPVSQQDVVLSQLASAYAALCNQFQKDPMKCEAYRNAMKVLDK